ncbi:hypothetical protein TNCV_2207571 [Trichonephila clavipes]|uniref:Uncharacterized protein n=1 Tax=Trichonephila clavipes TaxID=2585209 RepID=A0A8X6S3W0_TRICX|nr:hypothetical protein TNCV_2207571 [Trichonephila clavipes]
MFIRWRGSKEREELAQVSKGQNYKFSGYGHELVAGVSRVLSLEPLSTHRVEGPMHIKSVEVQTAFRWCGMEAWRSDASSSVVLVT